MYISYKEKNIKESERKQHNKNYIKNKLIEEKEYFDNMYKKIDNNIILDENQRKIILTDEKYTMVIAGAGSGKTTTISAKVNYLIEKQKIKDEEIIIISFTNKAVDELKKRINIDFKHNVNITTFHKLGYEIIKSNVNHQPRITKDNSIIKEYIEKEIINNPKTLKEFLELYIYYFDISEEILIFKNYDKYIKYKYKEEYPTLKSKMEYINKCTVSSKPEKLISDYLYMHGIPYEYKKEYPNVKNYIPDFTIYNDDKVYYIEHITLEKTKKNKNTNIKKIRKIHEKYKTNLIEIHNDNIIEKLEYELKNKNIKLEKRDTNEIFYKIIKEKDNTYIKFVKFCAQYISLFKSKGFNERDFIKIKYNNESGEKFKEFIRKLYIYYQEELVKRNMIDFDDMINKASQIIKEKDKINLKYKYIIIDEYQDISDCRFVLIKNILKKINTKIMVVGDDWQCIYSFAASNINLFTNFKNNVGYCEVLKIEKTYRNSQELIDIAGRFIQRNKNQIKKKLISDKKIKYPITILKYSPKKIKKALKNALNYIIEKYGLTKTILILGRYTFDKNKIIDKEIKNINNKIIYMKYPEQKIDYLTVHSSKGLGYDNVILINSEDDILGFPSKIKMDLFLEPLITQDKTVPYSEERRLFYVALTRTKNEIVILTPKYNSSIFIKEIKNEHNIKIKSNKI